MAAAGCDLVQKNLELAEAFFEKHAVSFRYRRPTAGSVALVGARPGLSTGLSTSAYCHGLVKEHGVMLLPGECPGADFIGEPDVAGYLRFGFGRESFGESLATYDAILCR